MEDIYLNDYACESRLYKEYLKYGRLIIAYDFDNTVYDYHNIGLKFDKVINLLRECEKMGFYLIVFTCSKEERYPEIEKYLKENDIPYHAINKNAPGINFAHGKIYYNILLDDRAGLKSAYENLSNLIDSIKKEM